MTRRSRCRARVDVVAVVEGTHLSGRQGSLIVVLSDTLTALPSGATPIELARLDAMHFTMDCELEFHGQGHLATIEICDRAEGRE